jgi:uncharacterized protein with von Willebrand factor type A (vWA) domain
MYPFGSLPDNLAAFCDVLRRTHRFRIGPGELYDAARALELVDLASEPAVRHALRPILSADRDEAALFDPAFRTFFIPAKWESWSDEVKARGSEPGAAAGGSGERVELQRRPATHDPDPDDERDGGSAGAEPSAIDEGEGDSAAMFARSSYSPLESATTDVLRLTPADEDWTDAARALVRRVHVGLSRRWRPAGKGKRFDLRRTLRSSLQTGGEALTPRWLRRQHRAPRFVVLIDGSRSMSVYAPGFLQLAVALARATSRVDVFTFSTSLRRITDDVRKAAAGEIRRVAGLECAWGGGTSIGGCLGEFVRRFGERLLGRGTVVIIASDGLDVGNPAALRDTMATLRRRSAAIVWLNPLLDTAGYEPTAAGMSAARASISTFTTVRDATGLARLAATARIRK